MTHKTAATDEDFKRYERELALLDEILGLRAALAQEAVKNSPSRALVEYLEQQVSAMKKSKTWKVGRLVLAPARLAARVLARVRS